MESNPLLPIRPPKGRNGRGPGAKNRRANDFYPTPTWMTGHLLDRLDLSVPPGCWDAGCRCDGVIVRVEGKLVARHEIGCPGDRPPRLLEPCVGAGHIRRAVERRYPAAEWLTNDITVIENERPDFLRDATRSDLWEDVVGFHWRPDWIITNPPFSAAFEIICHSYEAATVGIAVLLRCTWKEPPKSAENQAKSKWLELHPPTWELTMERTAFIPGTAQDSATTSWFVWSKDAPEPKPFVTPRWAWGGGQMMRVIPGRGGGAQEEML